MYAESEDSRTGANLPPGSEPILEEVLLRLQEANEPAPPRQLRLGLVRAILSALLQTIGQHSASE